MHRLARWFLPLLLVGCAPAYDSAGLPIVGGTPAPDHPPVLSLWWDDSFLCSAVHIGNGRAVTAAHCLYGYIEGDPALEARWGADGTDPDAVSTVPNFVLHPDYATDVSADVAFVELGTTPYPPYAINTAPLDDDELGEDLLLVGFGRTEAGAPLEAERRQSVVEINEVAPSRIRWADPDRGICDGDSGGAALMDRGLGVELVGLLVEGAPTCDDWGAALRLDAYRDFLDADVEPQPGDDDDDDDDDGSIALPPPQTTGCAVGAGSMSWLCVLVPLAVRRRR
jgi:hypothetical protein